jgi:hypothetical protein
MRAYVGVLLAAVALGGALALHNEVRHHTETTVQCPAALRRLNEGQCRLYPETQVEDWRPGWVDPFAVTLAVGGIGAGLVMLARSRRRLS